MTRGRPDALQVVVVDDVVRFALHVWRYLGRSLGFGIGAIPAHEEGLFEEDGKRVSLPTADGRVAVWWVPADSNAARNLQSIGEKTPGQRKLYLIDVKSMTDRTFDAGKIAEDLDQDQERNTVMLVSSYAERVPGREVWPKSPETLKRVRDHLEESGEPTVIGGGEYLDVLVTGAGFEFRSHDWPRAPGLSPRGLDFGLPETRDLLWWMGPPFGQKTEDRQSEDQEKPSRIRTWLELPERGYPVPRGHGFDGSRTGRDLQDFAQEEELDEWWNLLLETNLGRLVELGSRGEPRRRAKREAQRQELEIREAYRTAIAQHDWGHLGQALAAARLPWHAWLTTNYTRFANRAVKLTAQAKDRSKSGLRQAPSWRVVATAQEAQLLIRELQDREAKGETPLFKLHGDVTHLQTMAIGGHDKELFSSLAVPVDNLYQVYDAAENFLLKLHRDRQVPDQPKVRFRFHVVGHGLKDDALVSILKRITPGEDGKEKDILRLVGPGEPRAAPEDLKDLEVEPIAYTKAEEYMATLTAVDQPGR